LNSDVVIRALEGKEASLTAHNHGERVFIFTAIACICVLLQRNKQEAKLSLG